MLLSRDHLATKVLLAGCSLSFCPISSLVACSVSNQQVVVFCFDQVLGQAVVRRKVIIAACLEHSERFTCHCWTPSGMLLLGTSKGCLLKAEGKHSTTCNLATTVLAEPFVCPPTQVATSAWYTLTCHQQSWYRDCVINNLGQTQLTIGT